MFTDNHRDLPRQLLQWIPKSGRKKRGRPRKNWRSTMEDDLKLMEMTWEEAELAAEDRTTWKSCVARCAEGTGRTKV